MRRIGRNMLIISLDAVGSNEFERLAQHPAVAAFRKQSALFLDVSSVFPSNTYPVHTSVVTGVKPDVHGVASNTEPFPSRFPIWNTNENNIRTQTLWQAAARRKIDTAAVLWPVTAHSKTIRYNIPEIQARPGKNQLMTSLSAGSAALQLKMFLRHRKLLDGIRQPNLDNFATACMTDILREYKPGLALIHLTAYDAFCHESGKESACMTAACESLDRNVAALLEAAGPGGDVIIFSDHSQIDVHTPLDPNGILSGAGLIERRDGEYRAGENNCFIECCGGSAFFHAGRLPPIRIAALREDIGRSAGFRRFLTDAEMREAGRGDVSFGFCAQSGYSYETHESKIKSNHGYPLDMPDYTVFYMVRGSGFPPGGESRGGSLLDIAHLAAKLLNIEL